MVIGERMPWQFGLLFAFPVSRPPSALCLAYVSWDAPCRPWISEPQATEAAARGIDIDGRHYNLRLLGRRSIDVSIFVTSEFPDSSLAELLDCYGEFNHEYIHHLRLKDEGLQHIENSVRVVTFTQIDHPIPHTVIYRGTPLGFR